MLKEMLQIISETKIINDILLVSKDESAFGIGKKFNCIEIMDEEESGVNNAVILANEFLVEHEYSCSIILPQDIPLNIIYEDKHLIVVDKPAGLLILVVLLKMIEQPLNKEHKTPLLVGLN